MLREFIKSFKKETGIEFMFADAEVGEMINSTNSIFYKKQLRMYCYIVTYKEMEVER